jgi:hypothetical protein
MMVVVRGRSDIGSYLAFLHEERFGLDLGSL